MSVSFDGFDFCAVTFSCDGDITAFAPVRVSASSTVTPCASGENFCGFAMPSSCGIAGVQLCGSVTCPFSGTAPSVGYAKLTADGNGGVKTAASGREYLVVDVDSTNNEVTFIL